MRFPATLSAWARTAAALVASAVAAVLAPVALAQARPFPAPASQPILIELYTSQGCSSCPRAHELAGRLAGDPRLLVLTFNVDYWDYLGWRDTFARPDFSRRQREYARALRARSVYTPQMVVNGARHDSGARPEAVQAMIAAAAPHREAPALRVETHGGAATVRIGRAPPGPPPARPREVWLVQFDPGPVHVGVFDGENRGRRISHVNVVTRLTRLGEWAGAPQVFPDAPCRPDCAVIVQTAGAGPVLAVARGAPGTVTAVRGR